MGGVCFGSVDAYWAVAASTPKSLCLTSPKAVELDHFKPLAHFPLLLVPEPKGSGADKADREMTRAVGAWDWGVLRRPPYSPRRHLHRDTCPRQHLHQRVA